MIMRAQSLLQKNSNPSDDEIRSHMQPNLCRCGTHSASSVQCGVLRTR
jgi:aerobic-type carbon monoxide dehydrogenase small subunit (CoxS/CutS family)